MRTSRYIIIFLVFAAFATAFAFALPRFRNKPKESNIDAHRLSEEVRSISIVFAGDLMQHKPQIEAARIDSANYDYTECFKYIAPLFRESDLAVINLETTLSHSGPYSGYPRFSAPAQLAEGLKQSGIDVVLLANNHICDKGGRGFNSTIGILDSVGLHHTGAFIDSTDYENNNPLTIYRNGFKISILNYTYGTNDIRVPKGRIVNKLDTAIIARDLAKIEPSHNNLTFVYLHWGEEYWNRTSKDQRALAAWLRSKGVDFIIGSHPHAIQPIQTHYYENKIKRGITAYSLGNFVSNQRTPGSDGGLVTRLNITKRGGEPAILDVEHLFVWNYKPIVNDQTRYYVVPSYSADSLLKDDEDAKKLYKSFITPARRVIGSRSGSNEIKEFHAPNTSSQHSLPTRADEC